MTRQSKQWATTGFIIGIGSGIAVVVALFLIMRGTPQAVASPSPHPSAPVAAVAAVAPAPKTDPGTAVLSGTLTLDPSAQAKVKGPVIVFLIARADGAKGHPVFAKRLDVDSWPAPFEIASSDSMMDGAPPAAVTLEARIDPDGDALTKEPGAPIGIVPNVKLGGKDLAVTLK